MAKNGNKLCDERHANIDKTFDEIKGMIKTIDARLWYVIISILILAVATIFSIFKS